MLAHNAPSVLVPVGRFFMPRLLNGLLALLVGALWQLAGWLQPWWVWGLAWMVLAVVGDRWLVRQMAGPGQLQWTGQAWRWRPLVQNAEWTAVEVGVVADWGSGVLLRWHRPGARAVSVTYGLFTAAAMPLCWHGLRCALYCQMTPAPTALSGRGPWAS